MQPNSVNNSQSAEQITSRIKQIEADIAGVRGEICQVQMQIQELKFNRTKHGLPKVVYKEMQTRHLKLVKQRHNLEIKNTNLKMRLAILIKDRENIQCKPTEPIVNLPASNDIAKLLSEILVELQKLNATQYFRKPEIAKHLGRLGNNTNTKQS